MASIDRKSKMAKSTSTVKSNFDDRFSAAKEAVKNHPDGILNKPNILSKEHSPPVSTDYEDTVLTIPISKVLDNPFNARQIYDENVILQRTASITKHGQQEPVKIVVAEDKPGYYYLMDGHYRKMGLLAAGKTEIKCLIKKIDNPLDLYKLSFLLNEERSPQSSLDNALAWKNLTNGNLIKTDDDIAELIGMSKSTVSKTLALLTLPESVIQKMKENPSLFGTTIAYEIVLIHRLHLNETESLNLVQKVINEGISRRDLQAYREKIELNPIRKKRDISRQHKIIIEGQDQGRLKEWDNGRLQLDVKIENPQLRREFIDDLKSKFNIND
jgi:ParB family transcriptional regulator, chromosome partitioning protein